MNSDINNILDKYFEGETTLAEEKQLRQYFASAQVDEDHQDLAPLFGYFEVEAELGRDFEPDLSFTQKKSKLRYLLPRVISVAASLVLLFAISQTFIAKDTIYKNKYTEIEDPREGLDIALEALGFASHKLDQAIQPASHLKELGYALQPMSHIKELEKTAVFNFDK